MDTLHGPYVDHRWWATKDKGDTHARLWSAWRDLRSADSHRQTQHLHWMRLYGNRAFMALNPAQYTKANTENRVTLNVVRAVVDRIHARISQQRPRPLPVSTGGNYSMRRRAKLLGRYLDAQLRLTHAHEMGSRIIKDALAVGNGAIKVYEDGHQVRLERTLTSELFVDALEAYYGEPRTLYQQRWVSREVLAEAYPDARTVIRDAGRETRETDLLYAVDLQRDTRADQVLCVEAWHLPSGPDADDGWHVVAVDSGLVARDSWQHDYFPFVFLRWDEPLIGFWSEGIPAQIQGIQKEINQYLQRIQSAHHLFGHPFIFVENAKAATKNTLTNKIGTFIEVGQTPPVVKVFQTLPPEIYATLENLYSKAFEIVGVQLLGGSSVPQGLPESGVGLRTYNDMQSLGQLPFARRYEQLFIDLAHQIIDRARDIARRKGGQYAVPAARDKYTLQSVKWSEVDMERDAYFLAVFPTSSLPAEPSGRLAHVESMARAGLIDPMQARRLLDFPDLESETTLDNAVTESIDRHVEDMLDEGIRRQPSPFMDLQATMKRVQSHLLEAECQGVPEERLELLRQYLSGTQVLMQRAQEEQMRISMAAASGSQAPTPPPGTPPAPGPAGQPPTAVV